MILCAWAAGPAAAGPLEDGVAASRSGDYATALRLLRPLADEGNAVAQGLYRKLGFEGYALDETTGRAMFWHKKLPALA